jgi:hypothetical protein
MQTMPGRKRVQRITGVTPRGQNRRGDLQRLWIFRRSRVHAASPPLPARANRSKRRKAPLSGAKPLAFLHLPQAPAAGQCPARPALRPFTPFFEIALLERGGVRGWGRTRCVVRYGSPLPYLHPSVAAGLLRYFPAGKCST